jgi:hypothetical protein
MTKRQLIDEIMQLNQSAKPEFLARFGDDELNDYLRHLRQACRPRRFWSEGQFDRYFASLVAPRPRQAAGRVDLASLVNRATTALMPDFASATAIAEGPYVDEYAFEEAATPPVETWQADLANEETQIEDMDVVDDAEAVDAEYAHDQASDEDEADDAAPVDECAEDEDEDFLAPAAMDDNATSVDLPPLERDEPEAACDEPSEEEPAKRQDRPQVFAEQESGIAEPQYGSTPEGIQEAFLF